MQVYVECINLGLGYGILGDGRVGNICTMIDMNGEETEDMESAVSVILQFDEGFLAVDLTQFEHVALH